MMKRLVSFMLVAGLVAWLPLHAEVSLPAFFSDGMVLQQQAQVALWGRAAENKTLKVKTSWDNRQYKVTTDANGAWRLEVSTPAAGGPYSIVFHDGKELRLDNVLVGEVWFCSGQSNMEMPVKGYAAQPVEGGLNDAFLAEDASLKLFTVARKASALPLDDVKGEWKSATPESVLDFSATAYYFGRYLRRVLGCPVGLVVSAWGGTRVEAWTDREAMAAFPDEVLPEGGEAKVKSSQATVLFNGMVHPFLGMAMRGCIWYQGESNYDHADLYADRFVAMVEGWRRGWNIGEFPFYYCQITPYDYAIITKEVEGVINTAFLREAQYQAEERLSNAAMAVMLDGGLESGIHPRKKALAGERLAMKALGGCYGYPVSVESPKPGKVEYIDSMAVIHFDRCPMKLDCTRGELRDFEVAGADSVFYPAEARLRWNTNIVEVTSPRVSRPVAVRYAFRNCVEASLFGQNGMPVSSFRTDDWPMLPERIK